MEFAIQNHLKEHRARLGLTQEQLARQVGVTRQTISSLEHGNYHISLHLAFVIARVLDRPLEVLFTPRNKEHRG